MATLSFPVEAHFGPQFDAGRADDLIVLRVCRLPAAHSRYRCCLMRALAALYSVLRQRGCQIGRLVHCLGPRDTYVTWQLAPTAGPPSTVAP